MFFAFTFVFNRVFQIVTLLPTVGMLAWFVDNFTKANVLTPTSILCLFIVSTLALAWAIFTLFFYHRSSHNAHFVAFVDILFFGAFIAGVYFLRGIANADCVDVSATRGNDWTANVGDITATGPSYDVTWRTSKSCAMLKASFAFGIINIITFFVTAIAAWSHGGSFGFSDDYEYRSRSHHSGRHSHSSRRRSRSHSGSRHSHHSHRRVYV